MKKMKIITFSLILLASFACNSNNNENKTQKFESKKEKSLDLTDRTKYFLNWYKQNFEKINDLQLVETPEVDERISYYKIDYNSTKKYLSILKSSNLFSEYFLINLESYFKLGDEKLQKLKQNDGAPVGFEFDLLLYSQEPESILDNIQSISYNVEFQSQDKAIVKINDYLYIKFNNINLIDSIYTAF